MLLTILECQGSFHFWILISNLRHQCPRFINADIQTWTAEFIFIYCVWNLWKHYCLEILDLFQTIFIVWEDKSQILCIQCSCRRRVFITEYANNLCRAKYFWMLVLIRKVISNCLYFNRRTKRFLMCACISATFDYSYATIYLADSLKGKFCKYRNFILFTHIVSSFTVVNTVMTVIWRED